MPMTIQFTMSIRCDAYVILIFDLQTLTGGILGHSQMLENGFILSEEIRPTVQTHQVLPESEANNFFHQGWR